MALDDRRRAQQLIIAAALAGMSLRLMFGLMYWLGKPLTHDEHEYLALAANVADGRGFGYADLPDSGTAPQFGRAPGYPAFLAIIGAGDRAAQSSPVRVKVAQSVLGGLIVALVGILALRAAGPRSGVLAAGIAAVWPPLVWTPSYVFSETLYSAATLAAALTLQVAVDRSDAARSNRPGGPLALAAGVLTGVGVLIRPAMLFFLPLAAAWLIARRRQVLGVALLAGALAVVAPWTARNVRVYGRFVLVASEGGVTFWTGNHPLAGGEGDLAANPDIKRAELAFRAAHPGLTPEELEPLYYHDAISYIARHPGWWAKLILRKAWYTIVPLGPSYALHSTKYRLASTASYLLLLPFAVVGARRLLNGSHPPTALMLLAAGSVLVCLAFFPQERFRIPVIDPTLIVCAAALVGSQRERP